MTWAIRCREKNNDSYREAFDEKTIRVVGGPKEGFVTQEEVQLEALSCRFNIPAKSRIRTTLTNYQLLLSIESSSASSQQRDQVTFHEFTKGRDL